MKAVRFAIAGAVIASVLAPMASANATCATELDATLETLGCVAIEITTP
jgi:hypothetical protein